MLIEYSFRDDVKFCPLLQDEKHRHVGQCLKEKCAMWDYTRDACGLKDPTTWVGVQE